MTSDKANKPSEARKNLDLILHADKHPISLSDLSAEEFDALIRDTLRETDLRELRGFKALKDALAKSPGSFAVGQRQDPRETVTVSPKAEIVGPLDFKSHIVQISRCLISVTSTFRRHESTEETTVYDVAREWGRSAYLWKDDFTFLVLRRPADHSRADDNLLILRSVAEKVPYKDEMEIVFVSSERVSVESFRQQFGEKHTRIAADMIWELASLSRATLRELESQAENFRRRVAEIDRLASAIHG
jgi:hypothetical protein